jgi:hypothetical protein
MAARRRTTKAATGKYVIPMGDYDPNSVGYSGEEPIKGVYTFRLINVEAHTVAGTDGYHWTFQLQDHPDFSGWNGHLYTAGADGDGVWKTQQVAYALTQSTADFTLDPTNEKQVEKFLRDAKLVRASTRMEEYEGEDRAKIAKVFPYDELAAARDKKRYAAEADEDFEDAEEYDDDEEEVDEDEDIDDEVDEDEEDEDDDEEEYDDEDAEEEEPEPEPEPAPRRRAKPAPAKAAATRAPRKKATRSVPRGRTRA